MANRPLFATTRFSKFCTLVLAGLSLWAGCAHPQKNDSASSVNAGQELANPDDTATKTAQKSKTSAWERWKRMFPWYRNQPEAISDETVALVRKFVQDEKLEDVHVEWRHRNSSEEWQRLKQNGRISPIVRYSAGSLHWTLANLHPPFFPRKTHYDPYSDTIYLQTNDPVPILAELAMAKTLRQSALPGGQAVAANLPVLSIYTRVVVAREVQAFARKMDDWELEKQSYRDLYPGLFSGAGVVTAAFVPFYAMPLIGLGGMAVGMVMGEAAIQMREAEIRQAKAETGPPAVQPIQAFHKQRLLTVPDAPPAWETAQKP